MKKLILSLAIVLAVFASVNVSNVEVASACDAFNPTGESTCW